MVLLDICWSPEVLEPFDKCEVIYTIHDSTTLTPVQMWSIGAILISQVTPGHPVTCLAETNLVKKYQSINI